MSKSIPRRVVGALLVLTLAGLCLCPVEAARADESLGVLDFESALRSAILNNPELHALRVELEARESDLLQAGRGPNPGLELELDGFAGNGSLSGFDGTEINLLWAQPFVLGGRMGAQKEVAGFERALAAWDEAEGRVELLAEVHLAFLAVLASQELVLIEREVLGVTERLGEDVDRRVNAGASSPAEAHRARVSASSARLELIRAEAELQKARQLLAARMGLESPDYESVVGEIFLSNEILDLEDLLRRGNDAPVLARFDDERRVFGARSKLATAQTTGELDLSGGLKHDRSTSDWGFVLQLSMPLRLTDKGTDGSAAAARRAERTMIDAQGIRLRQVEAIRTIYVDLERSRTELRVLGDEILPEAREAFVSTRESFTKGRSSLTDLLDAQRVLFDLSRRHVVVALEQHSAYALLQALVASNPHDLDLHHGSEQS